MEAYRRKRLPFIIPFIIYMVYGRLAAIDAGASSALTVSIDAESVSQTPFVTPLVILHLPHLPHFDNYMLHPERKRRTARL
jgi:hypothetical protein